MLRLPRLQHRAALVAVAGGAEVLARRIARLLAEQNGRGASTRSPEEGHGPGFPWESPERRHGILLVRGKPIRGQCRCLILYNGDPAASPFSRAFSARRPRCPGPCPGTESPPRESRRRPGKTPGSDQIPPGKAGARHDPRVGHVVLDPAGGEAVLPDDGRKLRRRAENVVVEERQGRRGRGAVKAFRARGSGCWRSRLRWTPEAAITKGSDSGRSRCCRTVCRFPRSIRSAVLWGREPVLEVVVVKGDLLRGVSGRSSSGSPIRTASVASRTVLLSKADVPAAGAHPNRFAPVCSSSFVGRAVVREPVPGNGHLLAVGQVESRAPVVVDAVALDRDFPRGVPASPPPTVTEAERLWWMWLLTSVTEEEPASIRTPAGLVDVAVGQRDPGASGPDPHGRALAFVDVALVDGDVVGIRPGHDQAGGLGVQQRDLHLPELPVRALERQNVSRRPRASGTRAAQTPGWEPRPFRSGTGRRRGRRLRRSRPPGGAGPPARACRGPPGDRSRDAPGCRLPGPAASAAT